MTDYFVRKESAIKLNKLLELDSTVDEQDWELELADIGKITSMLNFLQMKRGSRRASASLQTASIKARSR